MLSSKEPRNFAGLFFILDENPFLPQGRLIPFADVFSAITGPFDSQPMQHPGAMMGRRERSAPGWSWCDR